MKRAMASGKSNDSGNKGCRQVSATRAMGAATMTVMRLASDKEGKDEDGKSDGDSNGNEGCGQQRGVYVTV